VVLYFRQVGVFIRIVGLELDEDVVTRANASIMFYDLDVHFSVSQFDVLQYMANDVKSKKIDIIYTTAVVDHIFMWKLHLLAVACARVQALIAPTGMMSTLHHVQGQEGHFSGESLGFYPTRRTPKAVMVFCKNCEVASGTKGNSRHNSEDKQRPLMMMQYTEDMHAQHYLDHVSESGRCYLMEKTLKQFTPSSSQIIKDKLIRSFDLDDQGSFTSISDGEHLTLTISKEEWQRWKQKYRVEADCSYALANIRKKLKAKMFAGNMYCNIFPTNLIVSRDPLDPALENFYVDGDIDYLMEAFQTDDHSQTRPTTFVAQDRRLRSPVEAGSQQQQQAGTTQQQQDAGGAGTTQQQQEEEDAGGAGTTQQQDEAGGAGSVQEQQQQQQQQEQEQQQEQQQAGGAGFTQQQEQEEEQEQQQQQEQEQEQQQQQQQEQQQQEQEQEQEKQQQEEEQQQEQEADDNERSSKRMKI
jgi:DNA segregation ATPase FtsK/SpoIIIE-like protein